MPSDVPSSAKHPLNPSADARPERTTTFASLKLADYRWLWLGSTAMHMAMHMQMISRGWLILRQTNNSPLALSLVMVAFAAPMALISPLGGAMADRFSKKKLVIGCLLANGLMTTLLATLNMLDWIRFWHLLVIGAVNGTLMAVNIPSRQALISDIVPRDMLMNAISLANSSMNLARIAGPALAGVLIIYIDTWGVFYLIAICYLLAAISLLPISSPLRAAITVSKGILRNMIDGFGMAVHDRTLRSLMIVLFVPGIFGFGMGALLPVWARAVLRVQSDGLGLLLTDMGIGALVGSLFLAACGSIRRRGRALLVLTLLSGVVLLIFSRSQSYLTAIPLLFISGMLSAVATSLNMTMIQMHANPSNRGRILSISTMLFGIAPLGVAPMGALAEAVGTQTVFAGSGVGIIVFVLILLLSDRHLRSLP